MRALKKYDVSDTPKRSIESISKNTTFVYQNREFILLEKRRTRFLCMEVSTQKRFTFHALTEIQINE
jgi:hypothetical protein